MMQVHAALIVMTIMGCDDSGTQCVMLSESEPKWESVAACDAQTETALTNISNVNYPVVVAVCQTQTTVGSAETMSEETESPLTASPETELPPPEEQSPKTLAALASNLAEKAAPLADSVKSVLIDKPVHVVKDSYSWMVKKLR